MDYEVLRNCYIGDRYYAKGKITKLPDDIKKSEKSFRLVGAEAIETEIVEDSMPLAGETVEVAPLYLSDKPKPKRKRAVKKNG